jgi:glycosyltransferase involved in cell wall biosynthesis
MSSSAVFIFPTQAEAMGISLAEACAFSLPIVAANTGGVSSVVSHNCNGVLMNPNATFIDYADHVQLLLDSKDLYLKISNASKKSFDTNFTQKALGLSLYNIIFGLAD